MANKTTKKTGNSTKTKTVKEDVIEIEETSVQEESGKDNEGVKKVDASTVPDDLSPDTIVPVINGFQGTLIYVSPRTKEKFKWEGFGDVQEIELRELRNAKSSSKNFFINNWFMFDREHSWVINYLGLNQYYKNAIDLDSFEAIFNQSPASIKKSIAGLSEGQKQSLSYKARELVMEDKIDSIKVIKAIEESLGISLEK